MAGEPLGIIIPPWPRDPQGIDFGGNDMPLSPPVLARFGELYRLGGVIGGRRIVPSRWIEDNWTPRTVPPWRRRRIWLWLINRDDTRSSATFPLGLWGQMPFTVPDLHLTMMVASDTGGARDAAHIMVLHELLDNGSLPTTECSED